MEGFEFGIGTVSFKPVLLSQTKYIGQPEAG